MCEKLITTYLQNKKSACEDDKEEHEWASQEPLESTMEEAALNGTGDVSPQQQANQNRHASESGPDEQEETEEIERDVNKPGWRQPLKTHKTLKGMEIMQG